MKEDVLIRVDGISKKFAKDLKKSLKYGISDIAREIIGKQRSQQLRPSEFWAVKNISFELRRGECLGLLGHNGAGKSTLLKMLNGLIKPDHGSIEMHGRVAALIELGAGFNPVLTGRENIYNNAAVLGFTKKEVDEKFDDILDFSELADFIDTPVQNYSSGMKVRLGFAVAAQMEPDILIIDEVLAVGDMAFKLKCLATIDKMLKSSAVIFVSHALPMVSRVCTKALLLKQGVEQIQSQDVSKVINAYIGGNSVSSGHDVVFAKSNDYQLISFDLVNGHEYRWLEDIEIVFELTMSVLQIRPEVKLIFHDEEQRPLASSSIELNQRSEDCKKIHVVIPRIQFSSGNYSISMTVADQATPLLRINGVSQFQVFSERNIWQPMDLLVNWKYV
jgi:lipopolysaccharide transport system ATP-binding protein